MKIVVLVICILRYRCWNKNSTGCFNDKEIVRVVRKDESHVRPGG